MRKLSIICAGAGFAYALAAVTNYSASAQGDSAPNSYVRLQSSTPGTAQTGHANISGTMIAGQFQGGGAGLTGVNADLLDGLNSTAFLQSIPVPLTLSGTSATHIVRGNNASTASGSSSLWGSATGASGTTYGVLGSAVSTSGRGVFGSATSSTATGQNYGVYGESNSTSGRAVYGNAYAATGTTYGGHFVSSSTSGMGVLGQAAAATGTTYGGRFESGSPSGAGVLGLSAAGIAGIGVQGLSTATTGEAFGVFGRIDSNDGAGVSGYAPAFSGSTHGVSGQSDSTSGVGTFGRAISSSGVTYGVRGESASTSGTGVFGQAYGGSGTSFGVSGLSNSPAGFGVYGMNNAVSGSGVGVKGETNCFTGVGVLGLSTITSGVNYGGFFENRSANGEGVHGVNISTTGGAVGGYFLSASVDARALYGLAYATSGSSYGVVGQSNSPIGYGVWGTSGAGGWAVYAAGHLGASGTKAFRIDHPFDPENKYLLHYSAEGPEPLNIYRGTVTTNSKGEAWVSLPDYYSEINKDPSYQLTVIEDDDSASFVQAKVAVKIRANRFKIRTSAPDVEVCWEVKAQRNDRWVQKHGAPVETDKPESERGRYQQPELYGMPKEMGMDYSADIIRGPTSIKAPLRPVHPK